MKRYDQECLDYGGFDLVERPNGDWVRFEDVEAQLAAATKRAEEAKAELLAMTEARNNLATMSARFEKQANDAEADARLLAEEIWRMAKDRVGDVAGSVPEDWIGPDASGALQRWARPN